MKRRDLADLIVSRLDQEHDTLGDMSIAAQELREEHGDYAVIRALYGKVRELRAAAAKAASR